MITPSRHTVDSELADLVLVDKLIDDADARMLESFRESLRQRWTFGRLMIAARDGKKRLPNGYLAALAKATGKSQSELKYRSQFAEKYPTEDELATAVASFGSWTAVRESLAPPPSVSRSTGNDQWFSRDVVTKPATTVLGVIDLDPCSCEEANQIVGAADYFTIEDNGLNKQWRGSVYLNPPYSEAAKWTEKLAAHYTAGDVTAAVVLLNNATDTHWYQALRPLASAVCFPEGRNLFWHPDKVSRPVQGQVVLYLGSHPGLFRREFEALGVIEGAEDAIDLDEPEPWPKPSPPSSSRPTTRERRRVDYFDLCRLQTETDRFWGFLQSYDASDWDLNDDSIACVAMNVFDNLTLLADEISDTLTSLRGRFSDQRVRDKIAKLRDTTGRTAAEAETALRSVDRIEGKLVAR